MIAKELDPFESSHESNHDYEQAGQRALEQTASYLKRAYGNSKDARRGSKDIIVLNGVRLEAERHGIFIDHLILYPQGFILVENRSRRADLEVNALGEWTQLYKGAVLRIPSPLQQAERKLRFLQTYFRNHAGQLPSTDALSYDYAITLPDEGSFRVPSGLQFSQVCRAHKLPEHLERTMRQQGQSGRTMFRIGGSDEGTLAREDLLKVSVFLRQHHQTLEPRNPNTESTPNPQTTLTPRPPAKQPHIKPLGEPLHRTVQPVQSVLAPKSTPKSTPARTPPSLSSLYDMCQICGEQYLRIDHHEGSFQYQCLNCETHTPIERTCTQCSSHRYVRRSGNEFFLECEHCLTSKLLYINPTN